MEYTCCICGNSVSGTLWRKYRQRDVVECNNCHEEKEDNHYFCVFPPFEQPEEVYDKLFAVDVEMGKLYLNQSDKYNIEDMSSLFEAVEQVYIKVAQEHRIYDSMFGHFFYHLLLILQREGHPKLLTMTEYCMEYVQKTHGSESLILARTELIYAKTIYPTDHIAAKGRLEHASDVFYSCMDAQGTTQAVAITKEIAHSRWEFLSDSAKANITKALETHKEIYRMAADGLSRLHFGEPELDLMVAAVRTQLNNPQERNVFENVKTMLSGMNTRAHSAQKFLKDCLDHSFPILFCGAENFRTNGKYEDSEFIYKMIIDSAEIKSNPAIYLGGYVSMMFKLNRLEEALVRSIQILEYEDRTYAHPSVVTIRSVFSALVGLERWEEAINFLAANYGHIDYHNQYQLGLQASVVERSRAAYTAWAANNFILSFFVDFGSSTAVQNSIGLLGEIVLLGKGQSDASILRLKRELHESSEVRLSEHISERLEAISALVEGVEVAKPLMQQMRNIHHSVQSALKISAAYPYTNLSSEDILEELSKHEAVLLEYFSFLPYSWEWNERSNIEQVTKLYGVVIFDGVSRSVKFRVLGKTEEWNRLIEQYVESIIGQTHRPDIALDGKLSRVFEEFRRQIKRNISTRDATDMNGLNEDWEEVSDNSEAAYQVGIAIFNSLVQPALENSKAKHIVIAPDNQLYALPFAMLPSGRLPNGNCRYLIHDYSISYVNCGRELLNKDLPVSQKSPAPPLVVGDANYDMFPDPDQPQSKFRDFAGKHFKRLPGSRDEAIFVAKVLETKATLGDDAVSTVLSEATKDKQRGSPYVIHLALHATTLPPLPEVQIYANGSSHPLGDWFSNKLQRSVLAFSGINPVLKGHKLPPGSGNGYMTSTESLSCWFGQTEMVVLSACNSGTGSIAEAQGIVGFPTLFRTSGVRTVVASFWSVPDQVTSELMINFYTALKEDSKIGRAEALRRAMLIQLERTPNPFYWSAFNCIGDFGPLPLLAWKEKWNSPCSREMSSNLYSRPSNLLHS